MAFSPLWRELPCELVEQILAHLVDAFFASDPAYTWVCLRRLSASQKRAIERRFETFWLPKLTITLYRFTGQQFEYALDPLAPAPSTRPDGKAEFVIAHPDNVFDPKPAWDQYCPATRRNITVRLGEGYLSGGCVGGYILNDTDLPGLEILRDGSDSAGRRIRFCWKGAMNELLREEMYMRRVGDQIFADACNTWVATAGPTDDGDAAKLMPPLNEQLRLWKLCVQMPRRVAALKHRVAKSQSGAGADNVLAIKPRFGAMSAHLHKQDPDPDLLEQAEVVSGACCVACTRSSEPDIFEVVMFEESAVPHLPVFGRFLEKYEDGLPDVRHEVRSDVGDDWDIEDFDRHGWRTIAHLYAQEFGWNCCIAQGRVDHLAWQEQRASDALGHSFSTPGSLFVENGMRRWDILG